MNTHERISHPAEAHDSSPTPVKSSSFLRELEGLRALAALAVMITHVGFLSGATGRHILPGFLARMDIGVPIFFVLSGFLLFRPHVGWLIRNSTRPSARKYFARRMARLTPALFVAMLGTLILVPASRDAGLAPWAANALQAQSWRTEWDLPGLAQLWSLSTEVVFYVTLPLFGWLLSLFARSRPRRLMAALLVLAVLAWLLRWVYHAGLLPSDYSWPRTFPLMIDWFAGGMLLAVIAHGGPALGVARAILHRSGTSCLAIAAALFWFMTTSAAGPYDLTPPQAWQDWIKHLGYGAIAVLVVAPSALGSSTPISAFLRSRPVTFLGRISYGIFLWHLPLLFWVREVLGIGLFAGGFWVTLSTAFIATIAVAYVSWYIVERPVLDAVRRRTS